MSEIAEALKRRAASMKDSIGHMFTDAVLPVMEPIGKAYDRFAGAPTRAALAELQAGHGLEGATPAFLNQFGNDATEYGVPTSKEIMERGGVPSTALSDVVPEMYSDTGEEWNKFQKGGLLDPTRSGVQGMALDVVTDPLAIAGLAGGGEIAASKMMPELAGDAKAMQDALHARYQSKNLPALVEEKQIMPAPFELPKGLPTDAEGLEALVKQGAPEGQFYKSTNPYNNASLADDLREPNVTRLPTEKIKPNYVPKEAEVIDMEEALKRRAQKETPLDVVDEAPKNDLTDFAQVVKSQIPTDRDLLPTELEKIQTYLDESTEPADKAFFQKVIDDANAKANKPLAPVSEFPKDKVRDPSKNPYPPDVDPKEFQEYAESPYANELTYDEYKKKNIQDKEVDADILAGRYKSKLKEDLSGADPIKEKTGKRIKFDKNRISTPVEKDVGAEVIRPTEFAPTKEQAQRGRGFNDVPEKTLSNREQNTPEADGLSVMQKKILARYGDMEHHSLTIQNLMRRKHGDAYIGSRDIYNSAYGKKPDFINNLNTKMEVSFLVPSNTTVDDLPKVLGKSVLGKDVPNNFNDPFVWMDKKYGKARSLLEESVESNKPLRINTRSDLLAHDDYIDLIDPKLHEVNLYFGPTNQHMNQLLNPGMPSTKRLEVALQKMIDGGIKPTVYMDTFPDVKNKTFTNDIREGIEKFKKEYPSVRIIENPIKMDKEMMMKFERSTGIPPHLTGDE